MDPLAPVAPAPEGVTPDFHKFTALQLRLSIIFGVTFTIATVLLGLRLYTAIALVKRLSWDALFLFSSWCLSAAFFSAMAVAFPMGFGRHLYDVNLQQFAQLLEIMPIYLVLYMWPPVCAKLSILLIYRHIDPNMVFRYFGHCVAAYVVVPPIVYTVLVLGPCNSSSGNLQCLTNIALTQTGTNITSDLMLIAMPIRVTMSLNMPRRQKLTVTALLALGSLCVVFPSIRTVYVRSFLSNPDVSYAQADIATWAILELNVGLMCNSLAMLQPFVRRHMPELNKRLFVTNTSHTPVSAGSATASKTGHPRERHHWGPGRSGRQADHYMLHSIDKTEVPASDMAALEEAQTGAGWSTQVPSAETESGLSGTRSRCHAGDNSSERRIIYDSP